MVDLSLVPPLHPVPDFLGEGEGLGSPSISHMDPPTSPFLLLRYPILFGGEEINADFRKIRGRSVNHGSLGIPDPQLSAESSYNTSKATSG